MILAVYAAPNRRSPYAIAVVAINTALVLLRTRAEAGISSGYRKCKQFSVLITSVMAFSIEAAALTVTIEIRISIVSTRV
jgi:hypothetical protein